MNHESYFLLLSKKNQLRNISINYELIDIISMMEDFVGRQTSIDLGYYEIFDPNTNKS